MPQYNCRFCNKTFNITDDYYCHLNKHIIRNKKDMNEDELQLINHYHTNRSEIKKKSYNKIKELQEQSIIEYKHKCVICNFKASHLNILKTHLIGIHKIDELVKAGYEKEYIDELIELKNKRKNYMKKYRENKLNIDNNYYDSQLTVPIPEPEFEPEFEPNILSTSVAFNEYIHPPPLIDFSQPPPLIPLVKIMYLYQLYQMSLEPFKTYHL
jgi:hypothetical protein